MKPLLFHLPSSGLNLGPNLVEYVKVSFHFLGEKVELAIAFPGRSNEVVLLQCSDVMLRDPIMNVKGFCELVDIAGLITEEIDDLTTIGSATGTGENIPE